MASIGARRGRGFVVYVIEMHFNIADNEELQVLWVGQSASPQLLLDLFGVDDIFKVDIRIVRKTLQKKKKIT